MHEFDLLCSKRKQINENMDQNPLTTDLKEGNLSSRKIGSMGMGRICDLLDKEGLELSKLDLSYNHLDARAALDLKYLLETYPHLTELNLQSNYLNNQALEYIAEGLCENKGLKHLNLKENPFSLSLEEFKALIKPKNGELTLEFPDNSHQNGPSIVPSPDEEEVEESEDAGDIEEREKVYEKNLIETIKAKLLQNEQEDLDLTLVSFDKDSLGPVIDVLTSGLSSHPHIKKLKLSELHLEDENGLDLGYLLAENQTLTSLDLSKNSIGDQGLLYIAEGIRDNPRSSLETLIVCKNKITFKGVTKFNQVVGKESSLKTIVLDKNLISERD